MRILILGGSVFLGRAVAETSLAAGHDVTVLNRGITQQDVPGVAKVTGDRNLAGVLDEARRSGPFDLVVDTSGFEPETVALSGRALEGACEHYVFISSVSAFEEWPASPVSEASPTLAFSEQDRGYGPSKAECERVLRSVLGERLSVLYPGILIGPHENVGRLPWWLARHARGGPIVYPELRFPIAPIDARDVAEFVVTLAGRGMTGGRYVVTGREGPATLGDLLGMCADVTRAAVEPVLFEDRALLALEVEPWSELPLWAPRGVDADGVWSADSAAARAAGLRCRPLRETVADTWSWMRSIGATTDVSVLPVFKDGLGLSPEKEARLLAAHRDQLAGG